MAKHEADVRGEHTGGANAEADAAPDRRRKPLVKPELVKHGSLPEVTGAFIGTFSP